ncbi:MAG TPA: apolipoprotein N-acyltransferase [Blastocatellia bacterium]|nr:apolipoprotein N-acyltransferase [Blastocatellia bacterium]
MKTIQIRNPKSKIRNRVSRNPQSAIRNLQSTIGIQHPEEAMPESFSREDLLAARFKVAKVLPYQESSPSFISNFTLAVFSGILLIFAFPEWNLWSLGWVGTAPLIMAVVREQRFWRSLFLGQVTGTLFYLGSSHWITYSIHNYGGVPLWLSYVIALVFASALAPFTALFAGILGFAVKRFGGWAILAAPVVWAASEWLRLQVTGMGWNALGYSQVVQPAVIQISRFGGVYLVSALLVSASAALVFALVYLERLRGIIALTIAIAISVAAVIYGQSVRGEGMETGSVTVIAVQPNVPIDGSWDDPQFVDKLTERHIRLSEQAIQEARKTHAENGAAAADLVIWPESPMNFVYERDAELRRRLAEFAKRNNAYLLMSSWGTDENNSDNLYNSAMVIAPSGERISRYDKIALLPFGEYVPGRGWIPFMNRIPALVEDTTPGTSFTLSDVAGAKVGIEICFEATRPDVARTQRRQGASAFVQISNEAWFGPTAAARQVMAHAAFRAVENNVEMIRATNSGLSARIDRNGVAHDETPMFETAARVWKIPTADEARASGLTFYTRFGDVFAITCAALSLLLAAAAFVAERRKGKEQEDD